MTMLQIIGLLFVVVGSSHAFVTPVSLVGRVTQRDYQDDVPALEDDAISTTNGRPSWMPHIAVPDGTYKAKMDPDWIGTTNPFYDHETPLGIFTPRPSSDDNKNQDGQRGVPLHPSRTEPATPLPPVVPLNNVSQLSEQVTHFKNLVDVEKRQRQMKQAEVEAISLQMQETIASMNDLKAQHAQEVEFLQSNVSQQVEQDKQQTISDLQERHEQELEAVQEQAEATLQATIGSYERQVDALQNEAQHHHEQLVMLQRAHVEALEQAEAPSDDGTATSQLEIYQLKLSHLRNETQGYREKLQALKTQHANQLIWMETTSKAQLDQTIDTYNHQLETLQEALQSATAELESTKRQLAKAQSNAQQQQLSHPYSSEYQAQQKALLQAESQRYRQQLEELRSLHTEELQRYQLRANQKLQATIQRSKLQRAALQQQVDHLQKELQAAHEQLVSSQDSSKNALQENTAKYQQQIADLQTQLSSLQKSLKATEHRSLSQSQHLEDLQQQYVELQRNHTHDLQLLQSSTRLERDADQREFEHKLGNLYGELGTVKSLYRERIANLKEQSLQQKQEHEKQLQLAQTEPSTVWESKLVEYEELIVGLKSRLASLQMDLHSTTKRSQQQAQVICQLESQTVTNADLTAKVTTYETEIVNLKRQVDDYKNALVRLKREHAEEVERLQAVSGVDLQATVATYEKQIAELQQENDEYKNIIANLEEAHNREMEAIKASTNAKLEESIRAHEYKVTDMVLGASGDHKSALLQLKKDHEKELENVQAASSLELETVSCKYEALVQELRNESDEIKADLAELKLNHAEELESIGSDYKAKISSLQRTLDARTSELETIEVASGIEMEAKTAVYEAQIAELQGTLESLKANLQSTSDRSGKQELKIRRLEHELELLQTAASIEKETKHQIGELQSMLSNIKSDLQISSELSHLHAMEIRNLDIEQKSLRKSLFNAASAIGGRSNESGASRVSRLRQRVSERWNKLFARRGTLPAVNGEKKTVAEEAPQPVVSLAERLNQAQLQA